MLDSADGFLRHLGFGGEHALRQVEAQPMLLQSFPETVHTEQL